MSDLIAFGLFAATAITLIFWLANMWDEQDTQESRK